MTFAAHERTLAGRNADVSVTLEVSLVFSEKKPTLKAPIASFMKKLPLFIALIIAATGFTSCSTDHEISLANRLKRRNELYLQKQERRSMRKEARDQRFNAWFDRIMD